MGSNRRRVGSGERTAAGGRPGSRTVRPAGAPRIDWRRRSLWKLKVTLRRRQRGRLGLGNLLIFENLVERPNQPVDVVVEIGVGANLHSVAKGEILQRGGKILFGRHRRVR